MSESEDQGVGEALKPCPCCGHEVAQVATDGGGAPYVVCLPVMGCGLRTARYDLVGRTREESRAYAVAAWNRRAGDALQGLPGFTVTRGEARIRFRGESVDWQLYPGLEVDWRPEPAPAASAKPPRYILGNAAAVAEAFRRLREAKGAAGRSSPICDDALWAKVEAGVAADEAAEKPYPVATFANEEPSAGVAALAERVRSLETVTRDLVGISAESQRVEGLAERVAKLEADVKNLRTFSTEKLERISRAIDRLDSRILGFGGKTPGVGL